MFPVGGSYRGSRGASFAQILMKNLPTASEINQPNRPSAISSGLCTHDYDEQEKKSLNSDQDTFAKSKELSQKLIERYRDGETPAVSLLYQLAKNLQFNLEVKETVTTGNVPGFYFAFCVVIDGTAYKTGMGKTKKEARRNAAELALEDLLPTLESQSVLPNASGVHPPLPVKEESIVSDINPCRAFYERKNPINLQIPHAVRDQLTKLMNSHPEFSDCADTTAAFIVQTCSGYEVVALGTGNFNTKEPVSSNGRLVHDSHAVVMARRSFMRYLYRHLLMFFSKNATLTEKSIFQPSTSGNLLSLKSGITFHLYMNQLPKGAAEIPSTLRLNPLSISAWHANNEISLHVSVEGKVFSVLSSAFDQSACKLVSMSTTDKITQWQVLGYQGALLTHFIEPIYVQSILIGDSCCKDTHGMEMSVSQRVEGITSQLPMFYCLMRPHISLVPSVATYRPGTSQLTRSMNWSEGDYSLEVVDGLEGKTVVESPFQSGPALASRLCKAAMLHRFKVVTKEANRQDLLATSTYRGAKRMAKSYQEAKSMLRAYLYQQGFGSWLEKVSICDNFTE